MQQDKQNLYLLKFIVSAADRRNGEITSGTMILPYMGEMPDDLGEVQREIARDLDKLGYECQGGSIDSSGTGVVFDSSRVMEIDIKEAWEKAQEKIYEGE